MTRREGRGPLHHFADQGLALCGRASRRDHQADEGDDRCQGRRDPRPTFVFDDAVNNGIVKPDLPIPVGHLAWMQDQMLTLGQIQKAGDIAKIVSPDIRAEALKRIDK